MSVEAPEQATVTAEFKITGESPELLLLAISQVSGMMAAKDGAWIDHPSVKNLGFTVKHLPKGGL